jgi:cell division protein FtsL
MRERRRDPIISKFWLNLSLAVVAGLMIMVWEHVKAQKLERELRTLKKEADRLTYENGRMQMLINQWTSPSHLDAIARKDYGMDPVDPSKVIGMTKP